MNNIGLTEQEKEMAYIYCYSYSVITIYHYWVCNGYNFYCLCCGT